MINLCAINLNYLLGGCIPIFILGVFEGESMLNGEYSFNSEISGVSPAIRLDLRCTDAGLFLSFTFTGVQYGDDIPTNFFLLLVELLNFYSKHCV